MLFIFFFQAEDGIRDADVTGVQTCALPIFFWQSVLENTHQQFIAAVKKGRGDRLADDERLFSGLVWSGEQAVELGLVDGLGSTSWVARQLVGEEKLVDYSRRRSPFRELVDQLGVSVGEGVATRLLESRLELR